MGPSLLKERMPNQCPKEVKESFILDDFMVTSSIGGKRFGQKGGFSLQKSSYLLTKKI